LIERKFRLHGVDDLLHRGNAVRLSVHGSFPGSGMGESLYPCQKWGQWRLRGSLAWWPPGR